MLDLSWDLKYAYARLTTSFAGLCCLVPCVVAIVRFRLYNLQAERLWASLIAASGILNLVSLVASFYYMTLSANGEDTEDARHDCFVTSAIYAAMFTCLAFEGFVVVYSLHMVRCGRHLSPKREALIQISLWVAGVSTYGVILSTCLEACGSSPDCPDQRFGVLLTYCITCVSFLLLYAYLLIEYQRRQFGLGFVATEPDASSFGDLRRARLARAQQESNRDLLQTLRLYPAAFFLEAALSVCAVSFYGMLWKNPSNPDAARYEHTLNVFQALVPCHGVLVSILYFVDADHRKCLSRLIAAYCPRCCWLWCCGGACGGVCGALSPLKGHTQGGDSRPGGVFPSSTSTSDKTRLVAHGGPGSKTNYHTLSSREDNDAYDDDTYGDADSSRLFGVHGAIEGDGLSITTEGSLGAFPPPPSPLPATAGVGREASGHSQAHTPHTHASGSSSLSRTPGYDTFRSDEREAYT
jgi:hypothetical protein